MDYLVEDLGPQARVLDLGAGGGSFNYSATLAKVLAIDLDFPKTPPPSNARRILAVALRLPLRSASVDAVVCNHTLEHFEDLAAVLGELGRVLRPGGMLWAAVPDGYSIDDRLYRYIFDGGGHVNQFRFEDFLQVVEREAGVRAEASKGLNSGFVYLYPPQVEKLPFYSQRARRLAELPPKWLRRASVLLNYLARTLEKAGWRGLSRYGWGVVFRRFDDRSGEPPRRGARLSTQPEYWNVCCHCGAGNPAPKLRPYLKRVFLWVKIYRCPGCGQANLFSHPPRRSS
ncbi:MAG TPA: methyltransferase domain-containing protein [Acidobacteriota bacterium]|nr:methyltransferase domain-containing protein [Acidobacteriota bacterium]